MPLTQSKTFLSVFIFPITVNLYDGKYFTVTDATITGEHRGILFWENEK